jgi:hypothetical protein
MLAALNRNRAARNRHQAALARHEMRTWQVERRKRTRHLIELGGLIVKAGIVDLTGDDRATIYGALLWAADKLNSDEREKALALSPPRRTIQMVRDRWRAARRPHISQRRPPSRGLPRNGDAHHGLGVSRTSRKARLKRWLKMRSRSSALVMMML